MPDQRTPKDFLQAILPIGFAGVFRFQSASSQELIPCVDIGEPSRVIGVEDHADADRHAIARLRPAAIASCHVR